MPIWENTESKIFIIQCVIIWTTLLIAIIKCARYGGESEESQGIVIKSNKEYKAKTSSKPNAPMLNFVTIDEIYEMPLEMLQSVPQEQMEQLPPDKRQLVKRRLNELIQAERAKQNK